MQSSWKHLLAAAFYFAGLLLLLNLATPGLYRSIPNDYSRTQILLKTIRSDKFHPHILVFGDSRVMTGVNAQVLREELTDTAVYNFASVGQPLLESALYYPLLPTSTHTVVQCVNPWDLYSSQPPQLAQSRITAFNMYGRRISGDARTLFGDTLSPHENPALLRNFSARGFLFAGLSVFIKEQLDDVVFRDSLASIVYPYLYPSDISPSYAREFAYYNRETRLDPGAQLNAVTIATIERLCNYLRTRDIRYDLVLKPVSPDLDIHKALDGNAIISQLRNRPTDEVAVIDAIGLLDGEAFYDGVHPNRKGAQRLSSYIASILS